jgi:hypothetical protein
MDLRPSRYFFLASERAAEARPAPRPRSPATHRSGPEGRRWAAHAGGHATPSVGRPRDREANEIGTLPRPTLRHPPRDARPPPNGKIMPAGASGIDTAGGDPA